MHNPRAKWWRVLGITTADADAAKAAVLAYLDAHDNQEEVSEAAIRAVHPVLANDRVWAEVKKALGV